MSAVPATRRARRLRTGGLAEFTDSSIDRSIESWNPYAEAMARSRPSTGVLRLSLERHRADVAARLAEIPDDRRSLTGQLMGDPLPGDCRRQILREGNS